MINYKFEVVAFSKKDGKMRFCLAGRCNSDVCGFEVWINGRLREDVTVFCKPLGYVAARGRVGKSRFSLMGEVSVRELRSGLKAVLKTKTESSEYAIPYRRIAALARRRPICCVVDQVKKEASAVTVFGWAVSLFGETLSYQITHGGREGLKVERRWREDVQALFQAGKENPLGFKLEFPCGDASFCKLRISSGEASVTLTLPLEEAGSEEKGKKSLYLNLKRASEGFSVRKLAGGMKRFLLGRSRKGRQESLDEKGQYNKWRLEHQISEEELENQKVKSFPAEPCISIVVPLYNTPKTYLSQMIESVQGQTYGKWELCLADGSTDSSVEEVVRDYLKDPRIRYQKLERNGGIAENTNRAMEMAGGEFIGFLDHDDMLAENALYEVVFAVNEDPSADVIYSDEDKVSEDSSCYQEPYFKPDFNLDMLRNNNYICHFLVIKRGLAEKVGKFDSSMDGSQDYDYVLRSVEKAEKVLHIPTVLYHWRIHGNSTAGAAANKAYIGEAGKRALEAHLKRTGTAGTVYPLEAAGFYRVEYELLGEPLVSILIPNRNEKESLQTCIDSICEKTLYQNYEILVIENNSSEEDIFLYYEELERQKKAKVIYWKDKFNYAAINNFGARQAGGDYYLLLNNDTEVINPGWLSNMLGICQRPEVGIVGAMLYYPDDTIQHAGVVLGIGGIAGHIFKGFPRDYTGHFMRPMLQQDLSAVTAACLIVKKDVYWEVGGMEERLEVAFNDVDFCLKVREGGYLIVLEPAAELYHYESKSRGIEDTPEKVERFNRESAYIAERWRPVLEAGDPYYNRNLTLEQEDMSLVF